MVQHRWIAFAALVVVMLLVEVILASSGTFNYDGVVPWWIALPFVALSLGLFVSFVVFSPIFASGEQRLTTREAAIGVGVSTLLNIFAFALLYRWLGFQDSGGDPGSFWDSVYFSAVTFSTLGYGDFAPAPDARIMAAIEALLGNLHLGLFVAAVFAAYQED